MTTFLNIYTAESMILPNNYGLARVQRCNHPLSVSFELDEDSIEFLKNNLKIDGSIYMPTLKKIAENIIILNREIHFSNGEARISLMNLANYNYLPTSFNYTTH
ncbi:hypothetical protein [Brochothrix thermosphacta]|uniref:Uncharacterized protein n=1 Tax=Brochothrix thermosphacta TaxID=2756 RepID=A0A1D2LNY8_BROTH|nr:hypothetical protein [Brochothrix thermosphacta]ATF26258.1 hypothetical protein CNY62_07655 [Brochothrix thermosphacta]ATH85599.1 hypothetical protein CPF12_07250 [Brochothrix thermosphacta]MPQ28638.1 hypothetical protein [Brochothrix thermosphacta]ODJ68478.1 hypothetical protein BFR36_01425 [Brochothrix thermosphacta]ODJ71673.1 hypothetical protein BFR45_10510 [Brochothrix thermosphacta]